MGRSRRYVWTDLFASAAALVAALVAWKVSSESTDRDRIPVSPKWLLAGATTSVVQRCLIDRNVAGIGESRLRRLSAESLWAALTFRYLPSRGAVSYNYGVGTCVGAVCYRLADVVRGSSSE